MMRFMSTGVLVVAVVAIGVVSMIITSESVRGKEGDNSIKIQLDLKKSLNLGQVYDGSGIQIVNSRNQKFCPLGDCNYTFQEKPTLTIGNEDLQYVRLLGKIKVENKTGPTTIESQFLRLDGDLNVKSMKTNTLTNQKTHIGWLFCYRRYNLVWCHRNCGYE